MTEPYRSPAAGQGYVLAYVALAVLAWAFAGLIWWLRGGI